MMNFSSEDVSAALGSFGKEYEVKTPSSSHADDGRAFRQAGSGKGGRFFLYLVVVAVLFAVAFLLFRMLWPALMTDGDSSVAEGQPSGTAFVASLPDEKPTLPFNATDVGAESSSGSSATSPNVSSAVTPVSSVFRVSPVTQTDVTSTGATGPDGAGQVLPSAHAEPQATPQTTAAHVSAIAADLVSVHTSSVATTQKITDSSSSPSAETVSASTGVASVRAEPVRDNVRSNSVRIENPLPSSSLPIVQTSTPRASLKNTAATGGKHIIELTATESSWCSFRPQGGPRRDVTLRKGETMTYEFETSLVLRLGNSGGVRIRYDGKALPSVGRSGEARNVSFPR